MLINCKHVFSRLWVNIIIGPFEMAIALAVAILGFSGLISGTAVVPASVESVLPLWLIFAWSIGLAAGGSCTIAGRILEWDRLETVGLGFLIYGNFVYCTVLLVAGKWPSATPTFLIMLAIILGSFIRISVLIKARQIVREADERVHHEEE